MREHRAFIIGSSLFAETLKQLLTNAAAVSVVGHAFNIEESLPFLNTLAIDVLIVANHEYESGQGDFIRLLSDYPGLPILYVSLSTNTVQVITSQQVHANLTNLLDILAALPDSSHTDHHSNL